MSGLMDEIRADQRHCGTQCQTCAWLSGLAPAEQAEWAEVMAERSLTSTSIARAARRRGCPVGESSIAKHRAEAHP